MGGSQLASLLWGRVVGWAGEEAGELRPQAHSRAHIPFSCLLGTHPFSPIPPTPLLSGPCQMERGPQCSPLCNGSGRVGVGMSKDPMRQAPFPGDLCFQLDPPLSTPRSPGFLLGGIDLPGHEQSVPGSFMLRYSVPASLCFMCWEGAEGSSSRPSCQGSGPRSALASCATGGAGTSASVSSSVKWGCSQP